MKETHILGETDEHPFRMLVVEWPCSPTAEIRIPDDSASCCYLNYPNDVSPADCIRKLGGRCGETVGNWDDEGERNE